MISLKLIELFKNLTGNKFMPKSYLNQSGFTYSAYRPFTKYHERIQKFRKKGNLEHLYRNELDKTCLAHDTAYADSTYLAKRTISDKILKIELMKSL